MGEGKEKRKILNPHTCTQQAVSFQDSRKLKLVESNHVDLSIIDEKNCPVNPKSVPFEDSFKLIGRIMLYERDCNLIDPEKMIEGGKLNDNIVEALMHALFVKHKVKKTYIFCNEICYDVLYKFQHSRIQKADFKNNNIIVGFLNLNQNHWAVIYADKVSRTFFYIDPYIANDSEINMSFKKWNKII